MNIPQDQIGCLDQLDEQLARRLAEKIQNSNTAVGVQERKFGNGSPLAYNLLGKRGEIFYCRLRRTKLNESDIPDKADTFLHNGKSVDVKTSTGLHKQLLVPLWKKEKPCDIYALVLAVGDGLYFAGEITKEELFKDENIQDLGYGPTYAIPQNKLHK